MQLYIQTAIEKTFKTTFNGKIDEMQKIHQYIVIHPVKSLHHMEAVVASGFCWTYCTNWYGIFREKHGSLFGHVTQNRLIYSYRRVKHSIKQS